MENVRNRRICARTAATGAVLALLAGCATAPHEAPRGGAAPARASLYLCAMHVSNAPAADAHGRILSFTPYYDARGVELARAPVKACLSSGFGPRKGGAGRFHKGVDLYTRAPAPVYAAASGVVVEAGRERGYGNVITIRHGAGVETRYAHLSVIDVRRGAHVRAGEQIAMTGRTGNATAVHLHYEIIIGGRRVDPLAR
ncbi:MAG: peptidoglycan DD-metalloendopeptidase family protein [Alphaproteobacteria bacterium]|nr:peptidoglycan DD-metalloendopeptidase family protein [Alphaproteobacteria bacterium]